MVVETKNATCYSSVMDSQPHYNTPAIKKEKRRRIHDFLLTFFSLPHKVEHIELNGFVLHRYFSNASMKWEVAIYTPESWKTSQEYLRNRSENKGQDSLV